MLNAEKYWKKLTKKARKEERKLPKAMLAPKDRQYQSNHSNIT